MAARGEFESHCYVDDPGFAVAGVSLWSRRRTFTLVLLFLMCLGLDISWMKAQYGKSIEWLGVRLDLCWHEGQPAVKVTILAAKVADMLAEIDEILKGGNLTEVKKLRRAAGRVGWLAGFIPWARAFASSLYAAVAGDMPQRSGAKRPQNFRCVRQAKTAFKWTRRLLQGEVRSADGGGMPLERIFSVKEPAASKFVIRCDASPWGFGALLEQDGPPVSWWPDGISSQDRKVMPGELGDPA